MKRMFLIVSLLLSTVWIGLAQHQPVHGIPVFWTWPTPVDANSAENRAKLKDVTAWLAKHGTPGSYALAFYKMDAPGQVEGPNWPYLIFCMDFVGPQPTMQFDRDHDMLRFEDNPKCRVHDFALVLHSPGVTLTELMARFKFGNPSVELPFPDPDAKPAPAPPVSPVKPAVPVGLETSNGSGIFFAEGNDAEWTDARGTFKLEGRDTPFGHVQWYRKVK